METSFYLIRIKEKNNAHIIETEYNGNVDEKFLIDFFGLNDDDVEWYEIKDSDNRYDKRVCCICGKKIEGWGNNPWPIKDSGECCSECNYTKVLPERIKRLKR